MRKNLTSITNDYVPSILNCYSVVFFLNSRLFGMVLLFVSFINFFAGLSGLLAAITAVVISRSMGFDEGRIKQGIYGFNAVLTGIGMGTFFEPGFVYFILLFTAVLFSIMLSVAMGGWFGRHGLPFLSIPFVFSFWLILLPSGLLANLGLTQRVGFLMNGIYPVGDSHFINFFRIVENLPLNKITSIYLRSLSSIIFQDRILSGILIAAALLACSRIAFLLSVTGFLTAYLFAQVAGSETIQFSFYNVGANYILVAIAAGGFFVIPSRQSFLWVVLLVPMTSLMILFMTKLVPLTGVPFFSLPFSFITILYVYFLLMRIRPGKPALTPYQHYSPERNLYSFTGNAARIRGYLYVPLQLPFWGEWKVSQGYDGEHTHKGEWGQAIDFVLIDETGNTHGTSSASCDDFYCYAKPLVAPAGGKVAEVIDNVDDNEPGKVNLLQNWGNTIILNHSENLYTQISHLKPGSYRVKKGDYVKKGDLLALCGNSGRSPEPHIHFQVQATPLQGARTLSYPFSYYLRSTKGGQELKYFTVPEEGERVSNILTNSLMKEAFDLQPGSILKFRYVMNDSKEMEATWEVFTDSLNGSYLYCRDTHATAWFVNDGTMFYFTSFFGNRKSLLYFFYLGAYRMLLGYYENLNVEDIIPIHNISRDNLLRFMHDFVSPFHQFITTKYSVRPHWADSHVNPRKIKMSSVITLSYLSKMREEGHSVTVLSDNRISSFSFESSRIKIWAQRADF